MKITRKLARDKADEFAYSNEDITGWLVGLAVSKLPASALSVGVLLVAKFLNRKSGRCYPSIPKIMATLGRPESTVKDGIRALVGAGLLSVESRGAGKSNEYKLEIDRAFVMAMETGGRNLDGSGGRNFDGWGVGISTPEPENVTCEVEPSGIVPCGPPSQSLRSAGFDSSFQSESHATANIVGARSR
ncbi:hypothetical protein SAMN05880590_11016 [Rhizobium sp. RU35A]|nr:hypothetical protein SAMN05880590_11016 [Rhizobium sp. RU35A]